jgi:hypothetical protein
MLTYLVSFIQLQMVAPNPLYGPQMNLVAINISDPAPAPGFNWYNENATTEVRTILV